MRITRFLLFGLLLGLCCINAFDTPTSSEAAERRKLPDTLSARQRHIARQIDRGDIRKQGEFELRLLPKSYSTKSQEVIVIKAICKSYICEKISLTYSEGIFPPQAMYDLKPKVETFSINVAIPLIPIDALISMIEPEDPRSLFHQVLLEGFVARENQGIEFEFEYALGEKRGNFFRFQCPEFYADNFEESARMARIIQAFGDRQLPHIPCS